MQITPKILINLEEIVGKQYLFTDIETRNTYGQDETEDFIFPPALVIKPANAQEISAILKLANQHKIPVTAIGARTGLSGGALSIYEGIGLSTERLDKIINIDEQNLQITVEPAVITQVMR